MPVTDAGELPVIFVTADNFDQPLEPAEHRRGFGVQIEHYLMMGHLGIVTRDHYRGLRRRDVMCHAMRDESDGLKCPEKLVYAARKVLIGRIDDDAHALLECLGDELAGGLEPRFGV
jgi:hypothetical protein